MTPSRGSQAFVVRISDRDVAVTVLADGRIQVDGHDAPFDVTPTADGAYVVRDGDRTWLVHVAGPPGERRVSTDGCAATVEVAPAGQRRARSRGLGESAAAPMPGTVLDVAVLVGQAVRAGDILVTLEAMKMELPVRAPRDGVVGAIHCAAGDLVAPGTVLVEIV